MRPRQLGPYEHIFAVSQKMMPQENAQMIMPRRG
jgi:hypothetical protein